MSFSRNGYHIAMKRLSFFIFLFSTSIPDFSFCLRRHFVINSSLLECQAMHLERGERTNFLIQEKFLLFKCKRITTWQKFSEENSTKSVDFFFLQNERLCHFQNYTCHFRTDTSGYLSGNNR